MNPAKNPNYSSSGPPKPNQFLPSLLYHNFAYDPPLPINAFQQDASTWSPSPWNDNNFSPQPRHGMNPWVPSAQLPRIPPTPTDPLSSSDLRHTLLKKRQQSQGVKNILTGQKSLPKRQVPIISQTPQSKQQVRPSTTSCQTPQHKQQPPHLRMRVFWLLGEMFRPEYNACFPTARPFLKADSFFQEFLSKYTVEKEFIDELQALWHYWKSYVPKNVINRIANACLNLNKKNIVNAIPDRSALLRNYAKFFGNGTLPLTLMNDVYVEPLPQKPTPAVKNNDSHIFRGTLPLTLMKDVHVEAPPQKPTPADKNLDFHIYRKLKPKKKKKQKPQRNFGNTFSMPPPPILELPATVVQKRMETSPIESQPVYIHNYNWPTTSFKHQVPSVSNAESSWKPKPVRHVKPQESINIDAKIAKLLSLLDKIVTVDRSEVPKSASELLYCFLEHGSDHQLSDRISKETMKCLQETCNNSKIIRVLWVIGYLFFPKYESKLTAIKPSMEKIAARLFWICLMKTHKDTSTREEMRVILKLWQEIVPKEIASSIMARIKDTIASDPNVNLDWILNDKNIRKGTRIVDFYDNKYLINASTAGPKSKAKEKKKTFVEDSDDEVIILDKCDVIQPATSNQPNNLADKRGVKHMSDESLDARHKLKKRTKVTEEETDKIFTEFHRIAIPSKPVNLVKPVLRNDGTTDNSSNFNRTETGDSCVSNSGNGSGSGNQEQQQSGGLSKLELFRKKMEKDVAIASIGGAHRWNDSSLRENKEIYLRKDWTVGEFVYCVCSEEFLTSWNIVSLNGELRVKIMRK